jgi:ABC-type transport system involved in multi-copper enzyme maturation permease subunit
MFAALVVEREPLTLAELPAAIMHWTQIVGGFALFWTIVWMLFGLPFMRRDDRLRIPSWQVKVFIFSILLSVLFFASFIIFALVSYRQPSPTSLAWRNGLLTAMGACALLAACLPILRNLVDIRLRRVWALARLSFQEAVRNRALLALAFPLLYFLFAPWFISSKPETQLKDYVGSVFAWMSIFLLVVAVIIAAFSIPNDIRRQTIHTIVTKPVERFEIVLGRFFGFASLMSLVLFGMSTVALIHIVRGVDPDAAAESLKAREGLYGDLAFDGTSSANRGVSVGREWDYRSYISGPMPGKPLEFAIWSFPSVPAKLGGRKTVPCEVTFDIYRTTKGDENIGIECAFVFTTWRFKKGDEDAYRNARTEERAKVEDRLSDEEIDNKLAEEYGYYEVPSFNITDYHTMTLKIPGGLFKNAAQEGKDAVQKNDPTRSNQPVPALQARVRCKSQTQYIGMAKYDLYFRADDPESGRDRVWFAWNFYKAAFGLWLRVCMVTGLAVVLSTYLTGVISALTTGLLYIFGIVVSFIQEVAIGKNVGGGPVEAALRLTRRDHMSAPLEQTTINVMASQFDTFFRIFVSRTLDVIPDVYSSNLVAFVETGFNIGLDRLLIATLLLVGYLVPWFLLGYYMMKWREIASSN